MEKKVIIKVEKDSIADELGIEAGDYLFSINDNEIKDVFDYRYAINEEYVEVGIEKSSGEQLILEIEKDLDEDLGLVFESGLMDNAKSCFNKCLFCFVDQLPPNMRETLYFKDDDSRLSFLQGNYVTLTNMKDEDIERILFYHLSPINISVQTTDLELREYMLNNRFAGKIMHHIKRFADAGIEMNFQIVLCKGINDGLYLDKSIGDLVRFFPNARSMSVVPVGLTKYRAENNLFSLLPFEKEDCIKVIEQIHNWQARIKLEHNTSFVFAADEFYLKAEISIPPYDEYEDFPQIENGVGMLASMEKEFYDALDALKTHDISRTVSIVTGKSAYAFIKKLAGDLMKKAQGLVINVYAIYNEFFGENITVSGLLTGRDIISQLQGKQLGNILFIPANALRSGESVFLDDFSVEEMSGELKIKVQPVDNNGEDFINKLLFYK